MEKKETLEEAAEREASLFYEKGSLDWNKYRQVFIEGAKWQKNNCVQFINKLEDKSFDGWSEEEISAYLTACMTIKKKYIDTLNGN